MPTFRKDMHCQFCGFRFAATIRTQLGDGPDTKYVVYCPENGSRLWVRRRELTEEIEEPQEEIEARAPTWTGEQQPPGPGAAMPTFQLHIRCVCGHNFTAVVRTRGDDPPDKRYTVICPMNASPHMFRVRDLRKKAAELPDDTAEARAAVSGRSIDAREWQPDPPVPWYTQPPYPALLFAAVLVALGLFAWAGLAILNGR